MGQTQTGKLSEQRVHERLESLGLEVHKPIPDCGVDLIVHFPGKPGSVAKIQVKGRNPKKNPNLRWFQIRVTSNDLAKARDRGISASQSWMEKVNKVDFFILDAVKADEMWVIKRNQIYELIKLNECNYASRPDNIFNYVAPLKQKQKELNLDIEVNGIKLTTVFKNCKDNFNLILEFLKKDDRITSG
jgi:hypothetical protein